MKAYPNFLRKWFHPFARVHLAHATIPGSFRYGIMVPIVSVASIVGFSAPAWANPGHELPPTLVVGMSLALLALALYAGYLIHGLRSARDRATRARAVREETLDRIGNELRAPLNGILGSTGLLRNSRRFAPEERALLDVIEESVNASLRQIDNVVDFSRLEAGKLELDFTDVDLHDLINRCAAVIRPAAVQKGVRFLVRVAPEVPFQLVADGHHLRQILLNLLADAIKSAERGSLCLDVTVKEKDTARATFRFEIHCTGISSGSVDVDLGT